MVSQKGFLPIILGVIILLAIGGGASFYFWQENVQPTPSNRTPVAILHQLPLLNPLLPCLKLQI